MGKTKTLA